MQEKEILLKPLSQYGIRKNHKLLLVALVDKIEGKITQVELSSQCYLWSFHYALHEYSYKPLPITPSFMVEFYKLTETAQIKLLRNRDSKKGEKVRQHLKIVYRIQAENKANECWLEEMLDYFEKEKVQDKVIKIKEMLERR